MNFFQFILQDWKVNAGNSKGRVVLLLFRIANFCSTRKFYYYLGLPYLIFYKIGVGWFLTIEIPWNIKIGRNLSLFHGQALVLHEGTVMGSNCTLRHCTTLGNKQLKDGTTSNAPLIGNNVDIGSNVCIIGDVIIKDNVKIGSGAVVTKNISGDCTVVGNPAVEKRRALDNMTGVTV
ncbi:MAG: hypothetical protein WKF89_03365 [Chitinophagaceae bacterium]